MPKKRTKKNPAAVALGKLSAAKGTQSAAGKLGGKARAKKLTKAQRSEIARVAARAAAAKLTLEERSERARKAVAAREAKRREREGQG